jgi:methyltransferase-like protein/2-polyprenyl-3-methyl-5-hydroxy-6-metoxy-1,4-benzoquinol methylase
VVDVATSYDQLPYSSKPYALTHPDNLATIASLAGLGPTSLEHCRVLELGCGSGGNLIPMAMSLPGATFVGIDLSPRQIARGQSLAEALQLTNIQLRTLNIAAIDESFGSFDYIICHGVFSWVPVDVQEAILTVCLRNLGTQGVAFVSYNVLPGWHMKGLVREMLLYRVRASAQPLERVRQARAVLEGISQAVTNRRDLYSRLLRDRVALVAEASDTYLFHEYLEDINQPIYFHQFVAKAAAHGLQYLGDAKLRTAAQRGDRIGHEQYGDFLANRSFRRSLLCHAEIKLDLAAGAASLVECHATARARPVSAVPDVDSERVEDYRAPGGQLWSTSNRLVKALLVVLAESYPASLSFSRLAEQVGQRLGTVPSVDVLAQSLLRCWESGVLELHRHPPHLPERIGDRPTASPLARIQARTGVAITNLRHHTVRLDPVARAILCLLDGSHDRATLAAELNVLARTEPPTVEDEGVEAPRPSERWREDIDGSLERMLRFFQRSALLVA